MMGDPQQIRVAESPNLPFTQPEYLAYGRLYQVLEVSLLVNLQVSQANMPTVGGRSRPMLCMPLAQGYWRSGQLPVIIPVIQVNLQYDEGREVVRIRAKSDPRRPDPRKGRLILSSNPASFACRVALVMICIFNA